MVPAVPSVSHFSPSLHRSLLQAVSKMTAPRPRCLLELEEGQVQTTEKGLLRLHKVLNCEQRSNLWWDYESSGFAASPIRCDSPHCPVCQPIKSMDLADRLRRSWQATSSSTRHVVFTSPNCSASRLPTVAQEQRACLRLLHDHLRRFAGKRGIPSRFSQARLFWRQECTFSRERGFHPHIHTLWSVPIDHSMMSDRWLSLCRSHSIATDQAFVWVSRCPSLVEVTKYVSKPGKGGLPALPWCELVTSTAYNRTFGSRGFRLAPSSPPPRPARRCNLATFPTYEGSADLPPYVPVDAENYISLYQADRFYSAPSRPYLGDSNAYNESDGF